MPQPHAGPLRQRPTQEQADHRREKAPAQNVDEQMLAQQATHQRPQQHGEGGRRHAQPQDAVEHVWPRLRHEPSRQHAHQAQHRDGQWPAQHQQHQTGPRPLQLHRRNVQARQRPHPGQEHQRCQHRGQQCAPPQHPPGAQSQRDAQRNQNDVERSVHAAIVRVWSTPHKRPADRPGRANRMSNPAPAATVPHPSPAFSLTCRQVLA